MSKITIDSKVIEQALEALNVVSSHVCQSAHHKKSDQHAGFGPCPVVERHDKAITALRDALAQPQPVRHSVPSGYVLVPIRPTQEILDVFDSEDWTWLDLLAAASEAGDIFAAHKPHPVHEHAVWNKAIRDSVDSLLAQAGYQPDSSARHQLAMMNFDTSPQQPPPPPPECKTEAERTAYAFGWFKALETVQQKKEVK